MSGPYGLLALCNTGNDTFNPVTLTSAEFPHFAVKDLTGDGRPDVVGCVGPSSCIYGMLHVLIQQPDGTLSDTTHQVSD